jgi:DNA-binding Lrp family transcriptional regulator
MPRQTRETFSPVEPSLVYFIPFPSADFTVSAPVVPRRFPSRPRLPGAGPAAERRRAALHIPQVVECHRITGEDCFHLKVHAASIEGPEEILDKFLLFGRTATSIVVSTPVPLRPLPVPLPGG